MNRVGWEDEGIRGADLVLRALRRYLTEHDEYSLAECLEDEHHALADEGLPVREDAYGDSFVAQELAHLFAVLDRLSGLPSAPRPQTRPCAAPGCEGVAWLHWPWCHHHDLEQALRLDGST